MRVAAIAWNTVSPTPAGRSWVTMGMPGVMNTSHFRVSAPMDRPHAHRAATPRRRPACERSAASGQCAAVAPCAFSAASMIIPATALGCETRETWLDLSSVVVAFMRLAKKRSSSGEIAWSSVETAYQEGLVFQATPDTVAPNDAELIGPWVAAASAASLAGRSEPNFLKA